MFLRFMAGGSCHDIIAYSGVRESAFYASVYEGMDALIDHPELQIRFPEDEEGQEKIAKRFAKLSTGGVMVGCVGAIDGWLCQTDAPKASEVGKVRQFFSGHYHCYGVNVQACVDHHSRFTVVSISAPGCTGDSVAFQEWGLADIVKKLPLGRYIVRDNAYANDTYLLTPFPQSSIRGNDYRDSFNYHLSQLRIRVEMAFGLLVRKWRIFRAPLQVKFENVSKVVMAACILHNWCINQRLAEDPRYDVSTDEVLTEAISEQRSTRNQRDQSQYHELYTQPEEESTRRQRYKPSTRDPNLMRNAIVDVLRGNTQKRPLHNIRHRAQADAHE